MREKLQTLPVAVLKEMAKEQGIKGATSLRKAELIEALCSAAGTAASETNSVENVQQPRRNLHQNRLQGSRTTMVKRNGEQLRQGRQNQSGDLLPESSGTDRRADVSGASATECGAGRRPDVPATPDSPAPEHGAGRRAAIPGSSEPPVPEHGPDQRPAVSERAG